MASLSINVPNPNHPIARPDGASTPSCDWRSLFFFCCPSSRQDGSSSGEYGALSSTSHVTDHVAADSTQRASDQIIGSLSTQAEVSEDTAGDPVDTQLSNLSVEEIKKVKKLCSHFISFLSHITHFEEELQKNEQELKKVSDSKDLKHDPSEKKQHLEKIQYEQITKRKKLDAIKTANLPKIIKKLADYGLLEIQDQVDDFVSKYGKQIERIQNACEERLRTQM